MSPPICLQRKVVQLLSLYQALATEVHLEKAGTMRQDGANDDTPAVSTSHRSLRNLLNRQTSEAPSDSVYPGSESAKGISGPAVLEVGNIDIVGGGQLSSHRSDQHADDGGPLDSRSLSIGADTTLEPVDEKLMEAEPDDTAAHVQQRLDIPPTSNPIHQPRSRSTQLLVGEKGRSSVELLTREEATSNSSFIPHAEKEVLLSMAIPSLASEETILQEQRLDTPPLYGVLSALGASIGYAILMIMRCKGFMQELSPKQPVTDFMQAHSQRHARGDVHSGRARKGRALFCGSTRARDVANQQTTPFAGA